MRLPRLRQLMTMMSGGGAVVPAIPAVTFTCTTTGAQTLTLNRLTAAAGKTVTVSWGDGSSNTYGTETTSRTHAYAGAGVWTVTVTDARDIVGIDLRDTKISAFDTADLANSAITYFLVSAISASTIDTSDMAGWTPAYWLCYSMPAGGTYTIDTSDMASWTPAYWSCNSMPAGSVTIGAGSFNGWKSATSILINDNGLLQAAVDAALSSLWTMFASRTATGGTINIGGTNAAPSGTFQADATPEDGKEFAYELLNDTGNVNPTKKWATVTFTV